MSSIQTFANHQQITFQLVHVEYELVCSLQLWNKKVNFNESFHRVCEIHIDKLHKFVMNTNNKNLAFEKDKRRELEHTRQAWVSQCPSMLYKSFQSNVSKSNKKALITIFSEAIEEWNVSFQKILLYSPIFLKWKKEHLTKIVKCTQEILDEIRHQMQTGNFDDSVLKNKMLQWETALRQHNEFMNSH